MDPKEIKIEAEKLMRRVPQEFNKGEAYFMIQVECLKAMALAAIAEGLQKENKPPL